MMWEAVLQKLERLKSLDRQRQAFGAESHAYAFSPRLSASEVEALERDVGAALPEELRTFYTEVGGGGAGPFYGITFAEWLDGYRPGEPYPGVEALRKLATKRGSPPREDGYFATPRGALSGLLSVIDEGCDHKVCVVATGPQAGEVVNVSAEGHVTETGKSFVEYYEAWLDSQLEQFEALEDLMRSGATYEQISKEMRDRFDVYEAGDMIISIADVPKPAHLFWNGGARIYHGATQFPWYESVLKEWQAKNR